MNSLESVRNYMNPTPKEILGPYHAPIYRDLMVKMHSEWEQNRIRFSEEIRPLVARIQESLARELKVWYCPAQFICLDDCGGYSPHFFAVRFKESPQSTNILATLRRPTKTVVLFGDHSAQYGDREKVPLFIYVNSRLQPKNKSQEILDMTVEYMKQEHEIRKAQTGLPHALATYFDTFGHLGPREFLK